MIRDDFYIDLSVPIKNTVDDSCDITKLDKRLAKPLAAALRSGEYNQGEGTLRERGDENFCCLGVMLDLIRRNANDQGLDEVAKECEYQLANACMPNLTSGALGDIFESEMLVGDFGAHTDIDFSAIVTGLASEMNDAGSSFDDIADLIDAIAKP